MILVGGGFFGFLIASAIIGIMLFVVKFGLSALFYVYANFRYNTNSLSDIKDINKLKSLLNFWSSGGSTSDPLKVEQICNRILTLYPNDIEARISKVVFSIFVREYNQDDKLIFEGLHRLFQQGVNPKYNDDIMLSIYLYAYYCYKNGLTNLCSELIHELEIKTPDYRVKLETYIENYPIHLNSYSK